MPSGAAVDRQRMVMYESSHTDPLIVRVDNMSLRSDDAGSEAMLSSPSMRIPRGRRTRKSEASDEGTILLSLHPHGTNWPGILTTGWGALGPPHRLLLQEGRQTQRVRATSQAYLGVPMASRWL